jgi:ferredoxin
MPKVIHYRKNCIGCNSCTEHMSSFWKISDVDGKADLIGSELKRDHFILNITLVDVDKFKQVAKDCPARVIKVFD